MSDVSPVIREISNGGGLYMAQAARLFPPYRLDRPVNPSTVFRWATSGVRLPSGERVRLETARNNGRLITSREAITRFLQRQSPDTSTDDSPVRTPAQRQRQQGKATAALAAKYGI